jgi:hypothetical protein
MEIEKQERAFNIFYLESKSRGLVIFRSSINQDLFLIHTPYCCWIAIEKRTGKITKFEGNFYSESAGKNSTSATNKEKIAFYISNLPSTDWTIDLNFAQTCEWIIHRTLAIRIAKCFLDEVSQPDDPLIWELNEGTIDEYQLKYYRLLCNRLKNLWTLITRYEKKIKQVLAKQGVIHSIIILNFSKKL